MKAIKHTLKAIAILAVLDIMVVMFGLMQIGLENRTGHWAPFWRVQAEAIVSLID